MKRVAFFVAVLASTAFADEPASSYIFPAGGQRGTTVRCRVGGLNLSTECGFSFVGTGVEAPATLRSMPTLVLRGPFHTNPVAQQAWDYPKDMAAEIRLAPGAAPGLRHWTLTTSEGATVLRPFVIGDLPEVMEDEENTLQGCPQTVTLPVTVNGRIYPRGDLDEFVFTAKAGDRVTCEVLSQRLGHKLDARLDVSDGEGRPVASNDDAYGQDPFVTFVVPADGRYVVRIHDVAFEGDQDYVYRLTLRQGPVVTHVFPAGLRRGESGRVRLHGGSGHVDEQFIVPASLPMAALLSSTGRPESAPFGLAFQVSDLPEVSESDDRPTRTALPTVLNGQISPAGDVDEFVFAAKKGQKFDLEFFGRRLGSPISGVCVVADAQGKPLSRLEGDGRLAFAAPADGEYTLRIHEKHRETHGGTQFVYRVVASLPEPDFRLVLEKDAQGVLPGQSTKIKVNATRLGDLAEEIRLSFEDLPEGIQGAPGVIARGQNQVQLTLSAAKDAPIGRTRRVVLVGEAVAGDRRIVRRAEVPVVGSGSTASAGLAVTVTHPPLFAIETEEVYGFANRGATYLQKFAITRQPDFDGQIEVRIADRQARYLQGATGPTILVPPGEREIVYPLFLPEVMDLNRTTRVVLMGTARVKDSSGQIHSVTYTGKKQIVARVSPSLLTLAPDPEFLDLAAGTTAQVTLRVGRAPEIPGPVTIRPILEAGAKGIFLDAVTLSPDRESVSIRVVCSEGAEPGRLLFRAESQRGGHPVLAETSVRILSPAKRE